MGGRVITGVAPDPVHRIMNVLFSGLLGAVTNVLMVSLMIGLRSRPVRLWLAMLGIGAIEFLIMVGLLLIFGEGL